MTNRFSKIQQREATAHLIKILDEVHKHAQELNAVLHPLQPW